MLAEYIGIAQLNDLIARSGEMSSNAKAGDFERLRTLLVGEHAFESDLAIALRFKPGLGAASTATDVLPSISGRIQGELSVECQRCLSAMPLPFDLEFAYGLQLPGMAENSEIDWFETLEITEQGLLLRELVEDELLSAIPLAPKHADVSICNKVLAVKDDLPDSVEQEETYQPFTGLAEMLGKTPGKTDGSD